MIVKSLLARSRLQCLCLALHPAHFFHSTRTYDSNTFLFSGIDVISSRWNDLSQPRTPSNFLGASSSLLLSRVSRNIISLRYVSRYIPETGSYRSHGTCMHSYCLQERCFLQSLPIVPSSCSLSDRTSIS